MSNFKINVEIEKIVKSNLLIEVEGVDSAEEAEELLVSFIKNNYDEILEDGWLVEETVPEDISINTIVTPSDEFEQVDFCVDVLSEKCYRKN